jgi:hypothetical protein
VAFQVTVTALDAGNNTATGYSGTFQFTSTDHHATLPASPALVNGLGTFTVTLRTAGNWTITAAVAGEIEGTSGTIQVNAAPASHYSVQAPGLATAGTPISFTVTALDPSNNIVTGYTGTVHFGSSDPTAAVPANATLTNGTGTFQATLKTIGTQNVSATDVAVTTIVGSSGAITVGAAAATHFIVTAPASAVAGVSFSFAVKALDAFNNTASAYAGTVHFTSSDGAAAVPANTTLAAGAGSFQATLVTPGNQTIAAADAVNGSIAGVSNAIAVSLGLPARLRFITQPANSAVGAVLAAVVVEVDDAGGNLVSGSQAPITISSTPPGVNGTLTSRAVNGVATFSNLEIDTAGTYTLTAGATGLTAATSNPFIIGAAAPVQLRVATQPRNGTAGLPMSPVVVEVRDSGGNLLTNSSAAVTITSTPSGVAGTVTVSAVNGVATFLDLTITRSGAYTLTAAAPGLPAANSAPFTIGGGPAASLTFDVPPPYPPTVVAGKTFPLKLRAIDQYNNTATGYSGTVHFTSGDSGASLPADATLTGGAGTFNVTLRAVGDAMWVNAADTTTSSITTGSFQIRVVTAANTHLVVTAPATVAVADTFQFTITAADPSGNPVSYTGNVTLTSTDPVAAIPSGAAFGTPVTFSGYMKTAGNQTITVTDNSDASITGTSNVMAVSPGPLYDVAVSAPASAAVGAGFPVTARAQDQFGNTVTGWSGIAHFTSSDASAVLPGDVSMVNGSGGATATLNTAGNQTVTAALAGTNIRGDSGPISVGGAAATHFAVSAGAIQTAGTPFGFTVTALDPLNIPATNYARPLNFSSTDAAAVLPSTGLQAQNLPATLNTPGIQTITARDSSNALLTGTSGPISVRSAANATHFSFVAPTSATAGTAFSFTVSALDASNHVATGYADTVHFTSSDAAAILPADAMLTNGTATFIATLRTAGNQTLTVTDVVLPSMHNSAGPIAVAPAAASQFAVTAPLNVVSGTAFTFAVKAQDAFRNLVPGYAGTVHFSTNARSATVPVNSTLLNGAGSFTATIVDGGLTVAITATDMGNGAITGASSLIDCQYLLTITVSPPGSGTVTGAGLYDETRLVTPTATANPGFLFQFFTDASSGQIVDRVSMDPNQNLVANFKALAPALVATIASRTDGPATGQRTWTLTIGNSGAGTALGTSITAITTAVNGVVQTGIAPPLPIPVGDIAPGASKPVPVTLNLAGVAATARITLTLTITANGGGYTATPAITQFR